ncbi:MAG: adenylate/guanylate cyclase domain-containing protein [Acidimicrobiia bacterium]|nr:adenylate/guanylate cyclase domain-containing protein [Acidimicrobiia bacterium]
MEPLTGYARLGDQAIYYMTMGEGPPDLVVNAGFWGSIDIEWEDPGIRLFYQKASRLGRTIVFDRRGSGASDPVPLDALPPWESFVEELECVMDAVGSENATLLGGGDGGPTTLLFAANHPERVHSLVLHCTYARLSATDDYPIGYPADAVEELSRRIGDAWGTPDGASLWIPSKVGDRAFMNWMAKVQRSVASPAAARAYMQQNFSSDARALLPAIQVPTLVTHVKDNPAIPIELGRYVAERIEGAEFVELEGTDATPYWEHPDEVLSIIEKFVVGSEASPGVTDRRLATVMFTDIVDSTRRAGQLGDREWRALLDVHDSTTRRIVEINSGELVKSTGDGALAIFDGPGRAIRCAESLSREIARVDVTLRTGIHAGEVEVRGDDVGGVAVHLASRVMSAAAPGQIMVSRTVRDLVVGSDIVFADRGSHHLKGFDGEWQLYSVEAPSLN